MHLFAHEAHIDYQRIALSGSPEAMGRQQASYLQPVPSPFRRNPWEEDTAFLHGCAEAVCALAPQLWAELAAFAVARGLPPERGLFVRGGALPHGCSAVAWRTVDGRVLAGRNYDFYERMPTRHLLRTQPERGYCHLGMNGGLVGGRYDGVNERGLFVALHKVMAERRDPVAPGVPFHLVLRLALELCADAYEAVGLIAGMRHIASFNYTVADAGGNLFALECFPGERVRVRRAARVIAVANHYTSPALAPRQGGRPLDGSRARVARLRQVAEATGEPWAATADALRDHTSGVCAHKEFGATLWSGLFDLTQRRAAYAFGAPCQVAYSDEGWPC
jgi:hypothetical protein